MLSYLVIIAAAGVAGMGCARPLGAGSGVSGWTFRLLLGLSFCALVAVFVGSWSLLYAQTIFALVAAGGLIHSVARWSGRRAAPRQGEGVRFEPLEYVCACAIGIALLLAAVSAWAPATSWDAAVAHLALPADYARAGRVYLEAGNVYSAYPQYMHALGAAAFLGGGELAVSLLSWTFAALACGAAYALGERLGGRRCGLITAAILATAPVFGDQAGAVSIDLAFAALSVGALAAALAYFDSQRLGWVVLAAALAGSACGVRHTGYLTALLLGLAFLGGGGPRRFRRAAVFASVAAVMAGPCLFRSWWLTGNPVFPFLDACFPSDVVPHISISDIGAHESVTQTGGLDWLSFLRFPWDIVMRPNWYDGWSKSPGGLVLALGIPGLFAGGRRTRWLGAYSVAGGVAFFFFQRLARYLLPFFVPMMAVAALAALRFKGLSKGIAVLLTASFLYGLALQGASMHFKVPVVFGFETREAYLASRVERFAAFQRVNELLESDGPGVVLTLDQRSYYLDGPAYQNHWGLLAIRKWSAARQLDWLKDRGIRYWIYPVTYVRDSGALRPLMKMFNTWRADTGHFVERERMTLPTRAGGIEEVMIYEIDYREAARPRGPVNPAAPAPTPVGRQE